MYIYYIYKVPILYLIKYKINIYNINKVYLLQISIYYLIHKTFDYFKLSFLNKFTYSIFESNKALYSGV